MRFCLYSGKPKNNPPSVPTYGQWKRCLKIISETALPPKKIIGLPIPPMPSSYNNILQTDSGMPVPASTAHWTWHWWLIILRFLKKRWNSLKRYFPRHGKDWTVVFTGKIKKTFSTNALTSAKSNPACYIKKITNHCIWKNRPVIPTFNTKIFIAQRCNFLPFLPTNLWNLALCFGSKLYRNYKTGKK